MTKILILDDDPVARDIFRRVLTAEGYDVRMVGTAKEAIETGSTFDPDALITDWMLKEELDGMDVARTLLEARPDLRIYFVTGLPADHLRRQLDGLIVTKVYEKPMQFDPLVRDLEADFANGRANGNSPPNSLP